MKLETKISLGPDTVKEGELRSFRHATQSILVTKIDGVLSAMDDSCNHAGCLLSGGRIEGHLVICECHEIGFDAQSGRNMTSPGIADDQPTYRLVVENGTMFVFVP